MQRFKTSWLAKAGVVAASLAIGGCACSECERNDDAEQRVGRASDATRAALLGKVASLQGTWMMKDEKGNMMPACTYTVSSNGSIVREVMFPGTEHEMTNVYHMDGDSLMVTHYCAMGNQPRMRARANSANPNMIHFTSAGVTNLGSKDESYMGDMSLEFKDANTVVQRWKQLKNGAFTNEHDVAFELTRQST